MQSNRIAFAQALYSAVSGVTVDMYLLKKKELHVA